MGWGRDRGRGGGTRRWSWGNKEGGGRAEGQGYGVGGGREERGGETRGVGRGWGCLRRELEDASDLLVDSSARFYYD